MHIRSKFCLFGVCVLIMFLFNVVLDFVLIRTVALDFILDYISR